MVMVLMPRVGQPISCCMLTNRSRAERPSITSGITSGAELISDSRPRPGKRPKRASAKPAAVPMTTARVALPEAIRKLRQAAERICSLLNRRAYHSVEKPPQTVTRRDLLKE